MKISVKLHDKYKGKVCGLCGNYDGDDGNDYLLNGGQEPVSEKAVDVLVKLIVIKFKTSCLLLRLEGAEQPTAQ